MTSSSSYRIRDCSPELTLPNDCETFKEKIQQPLHNMGSGPSASTLLAKQNQNNHHLLCKKSRDPHLAGGKEREILEKGQAYDSFTGLFTEVRSALWHKNCKTGGSRISRNEINSECLTSKSSTCITESCSECKRKSSFLSLWLEIQPMCSRLFQACRSHFPDLVNSPTIPKFFKTSILFVQWKCQYSIPLFKKHTLNNYNLSLRMVTSLIRKVTRLTIIYSEVIKVLTRTKNVAM